ncbi:unnamed protein product, partial [Didymodactylos carnosus]
RVMVKLHGKRFKLFQKRYITANGTIVKAKHDHYQYLVKYKLNGTVQEDWFLVDDVTCQTVKEQEYRLNLAKRKRENDDNSIDVKESEKVKVEPNRQQTGANVIEHESSPLLQVDWNLARLIWAKYTGHVEKAVDTQLHNRRAMNSLKEDMDDREFECMNKPARKFENKLKIDIYLNYFGSEDEMYCDHVTNELQRYTYESICSNSTCPAKKKTSSRSMLTFM